jgi:hypothetical protein
MEFSKTVRFDFPRIPVAGTLGLLIIVISLPETVKLLLGNDGQVNLGLIAAAVGTFGVAGITWCQLVAMVLFDVLFPIKRAVSSSEGWGTSYAWFAHLQQEAKPTLRTRQTGDAHNLDNRQDISDLHHKQVHAVLHALEMECREKSPAIGIQLEYYYSLYLFFFISASFSALMLMLEYLGPEVGINLRFSELACWLNLGVVGFCLLGAVRARRMKEYLRIMLFNHHRLFVLGLLGEWFQCHFRLPEQQLVAQATGDRGSV